MGIKKIQNFILISDLKKYPEKMHRKEDNPEKMFF
jgi:hypothetical protein